MSLPGDPEAGSAPLVSVAITSFNSEKWLARAIDSVLLQQTGFPIEIVIGDDCSKDGTAAVARSYRDRNRRLIRVLERPENVGMQRNFYETFEQCRGKYIAWLDADDYWTDPAKLAIQTQLLESDPSISACGHYICAVSDQGEVLRERYPSLAPGRYGLKEIIRQNFLPSASIVFRNGIQRDLPAWYFDLDRLADWPLLLVAAFHGDIFLLDRLMAVYMLSADSAYMSRDSVFQDRQDVRFCEYMESYLPPQWRRLARAAKGKRYETMAYMLRKQGDFAAARRAAIEAFRAPDLMDNFFSKFKALLAAAVLRVPGASSRRGNRSL
jgi:glycosyltransferase involved in cell wall biosynthesis